jgi:hypothetical protein
VIDASQLEAFRARKGRSKQLAVPSSQPARAETSHPSQAPANGIPAFAASPAAPSTSPPPAIVPLKDHQIPLQPAADFFDSLDTGDTILQQATMSTANQAAEQPTQSQGSAPEPPPRPAITASPAWLDAQTSAKQRAPQRDVSPLPHSAPQAKPPVSQQPPHAPPSKAAPELLPTAADLDPDQGFFTNLGFAVDTHQQISPVAAATQVPQAFSHEPSSARQPPAANQSWLSSAPQPPSSAPPLLVREASCTPQRPDDVAKLPWPPAHVPAATATTHLKLPLPSGSPAENDESWLAAPGVATPDAPSAAAGWTTSTATAPPVATEAASWLPGSVPTVDDAAEPCSWLSGDPDKVPGPACHAAVTPGVMDSGKEWFRTHEVVTSAEKGQSSPAADAYAQHGFNQASKTPPHLTDSPPWRAATPDLPTPTDTPLDTFTATPATAEQLPSRDPTIAMPALTARLPSSPPQRALIGSQLSSIVKGQRTQQHLQKLAPAARWLLSGAGKAATFFAGKDGVAEPSRTPSGTSGQLADSPSALVPVGGMQASAPVDTLASTLTPAQAGSFSAADEVTSEVQSHSVHGVTTQTAEPHHVTPPAIAPGRIGRTPGVDTATAVLSGSTSHMGWSNAGSATSGHLSGGAARATVATGAVVAASGPVSTGAGRLLDDARGVPGVAMHAAHASYAHSCVNGNRLTAAALSASQSKPANCDQRNPPTSPVSGPSSSPRSWLDAAPAVKRQMPVSSAGRKGLFRCDAAGREVGMEHVAAPARGAFGMAKADNEAVEDVGHGTPLGQEAVRPVVGRSNGTSRAAFEGVSSRSPEALSPVNRTHLLSSARAEPLDTARDKDAVPPHPGLAEQDSVVALLAERAQALDALEEAGRGAYEGRAPPADMTPTERGVPTSRSGTPLATEEWKRRGELFSPSMQTMRSVAGAGNSSESSPSKGERLWDPSDLPRLPLHTEDALSSALLDGFVPSSGCALHSCFLHRHSNRWASFPLNHLGLWSTQQGNAACSQQLCVLLLI